MHLLTKMINAPHVSLTSLAQVTKTAKTRESDDGNDCDDGNDIGGTGVLCANILP